jgi:hypothetical protein
LLLATPDCRACLSSLSGPPTQLTRYAPRTLRHAQTIENRTQAIVEREARRPAQSTLASLDVEAAAAALVLALGRVLRLVGSRRP